MENETGMETLGQFLCRRRKELGLGVREMCRLSEKNELAGRPLTSGWYSRIETDDPTVNLEKVTMDFFWAVGVILRVDPVKLFVMARPNIPQKMADMEEREKVFNG